MTADPGTPPKRILFIIPAYNEVESVAHVVNDLKRHFPDAGVVVVDDGSVDGTSDVVPDRAILLKLPFNLGIGGAMQAGYRYAHQEGYDIAVQVDADGQHPPSQVPILLQTLERENADVVIGSRFLPGGTYEQSASRMTGIIILRTLIRLLTGQFISDCTSGFRACNQRVIRAYAHWYPDDYPEPEVCLLLVKEGFKVVEASVHMDQRKTGVSSIPLYKGILYVVKVSAALMLDTVRNPWPRSRSTR